MGRLDRQKGFDLLIEAFSRIAAKHPDWSVHILGDGSERAALEALIESKHLAGRVVLRGWVDDPVAELRAAELFVLSSRFEGFPNALLEAMACGLPAVACDCPGGPAEIIRAGTDGLLVPPEDTAALAAALEQLMSDDELRARLAGRASEVKRRFSVERFFEQWEAVLRGAEPHAIMG